MTIITLKGELCKNAKMGSHGDWNIEIETEPLSDETIKRLEALFPTQLTAVWKILDIEALMQAVK